MYICEKYFVIYVSVFLNTYVLLHFVLFMFIVFDKSLTLYRCVLGSRVRISPFGCVGYLLFNSLQIILSLLYILFSPNASKFYDYYSTITIYVLCFNDMTSNFPVNSYTIAQRFGIIYKILEIITTPDNPLLLLLLYVYNFYNTHFVQHVCNSYPGHND